LRRTGGPLQKKRKIAGRRKRASFRQGRNLGSASLRTTSGRPLAVLADAVRRGCATFTPAVAVRVFFSPGPEVPSGWYRGSILLPKTGMLRLAAPAFQPERRELARYHYPKFVEHADKAGIAHQVYLV